MEHQYLPLMVVKLQLNAIAVNGNMVLLPFKNGLQMGGLKFRRPASRPGLKMPTNDVLSLMHKLQIQLYNQI
jgi:hypothetical protein